MSYKSGFVTIVGRPNVGKSTFLNNIMNKKIAITSDKPQTTRNKITAIYQGDDYQIVFIDTPGMHRPRNKLGEKMLKYSLDSINDVDVVLMMVDNSKIIGPGDKWILDILKDLDRDIYLIINKMDLLKIDEYALIVKQYQEYDFIKEIIGISAKDRKNIDVVINKIIASLKEGPKYYPDDMITDQSERAMISEMIREKILNYIHEEIPHGIYINIEKMKRRSDKDIYDIEATIVCEKNSHKGILIGKGGRKLKGIGKSAREDMETFLGMKVNLKLWVKVKPKWRDSESQVKNLLGL